MWLEGWARWLYSSVEGSVHLIAFWRRLQGAHMLDWQRGMGRECTSK